MRLGRGAIIAMVAFTAVYCSAKPKLNDPDVTTQIYCPQYLDEQRQCVGQPGDVFEFYITIANHYVPRNLAITLEDNEEPPKLYRVPNGYTILERTPLKTTPFAIGEVAHVKIVVRINSAQFQSILVRVRDRTGSLDKEVALTGMIFNDPWAVERAKSLGLKTPKRGDPLRIIPSKVKHGC